MKRGFNGRSPKQGTPPSDRRWMPEVIFQPQETGPRNRANAKPIEATPWYCATDAPVFRPDGPADTENADSGATPYSTGKNPNNAPQTRKVWHPMDWK